MLNRQHSAHAIGAPVYTQQRPSGAPARTQDYNSLVRLEQQHGPRANTTAQDRDYFDPHLSDFESQLNTSQSSTQSSQAASSRSVRSARSAGAAAGARDREFEAARGNGGPGGGGRAVRGGGGRGRSLTSLHRSTMMCIMVLSVLGLVYAGCQHDHTATIIAYVPPKSYLSK